MYRFFYYCIYLDSQRQESLNKTISSLNQSPSFRKNCSFAMHDDKINDKFDCDEGNELSVMDEFKRNDRDAKNDFRFSFLSDDEKAGQKLINIERSGFGKPQSVRNIKIEFNLLYILKL